LIAVAKQLISSERTVHI